MLSNILYIKSAILTISVFIMWKWGGYKNFIGLDQLWGLGKLLFGISLLWFWFFISSLMVLWYGKKPNERDVLQILMFGNYLPIFVSTFFFVCIIPFFCLTLDKIRKSFYGPPIIALSVLIGNFLDRLRHYGSAYSLIEPFMRQLIDLQIYQKLLSQTL